MNLGLDGKVAFIAGSSRGIGLSIAKAFLEEGASVCVTGRDSAAVNIAREHLSTLHSSQPISSDRILALNADLSHAPGIEHALCEAKNRYGRIDAVVANIGSGTGKGGWALATEDWECAMRVNLLPAVLLASLAIPHLTLTSGNFTFVSSIAGSEAIGAPLPYTAAKAGLDAAMKSLARQAGPAGVRINAVAPGNILFAGGTWEKKLAERPVFFEEMIAAEVPLRRFGKPEEIADAVVFLASARSSFTTGALFVVDGGQTRAL